MNHSERVLVLAPKGRDGQLATELLQAAGKSALRKSTIAEIVGDIAEGAGAALITDEALENADLTDISEWIEGQSPWSDFPFIILTKRSGGPEKNPNLARLQAILGNVIFLERPFHPTSLISVVDNALRGRRRQYQARAFLEDLREGEQRLSTALTAGRMGSWELGIPTRELRASAECKANFGIGPDEPFSYDDLLSSVAFTDRDCALEAMKKSLATGTDYVIECRCIWPDNSEHWVDIRARVQFDKNGEPASMVGVSSDITARKAAEVERDRLLLALAAEREKTQEALRGEKALSELLMTSVPAGIVAYDANLAITVWNPVMERLVGVEAQSVIDKPLFDVIAPDRAESMLGRVVDALAGTAGPIEELEFDTDESGRVWLETQHAPLRGGDAKVIGGVAFFRDVTERRRAEEQLRQAQKMETIGQLTGGVAHDFNNLLSAILGNLELLRKKLPEDPQLLRHIDGAMQGATRGASLTQRLLAFARRQDLTPVPTDLGQLIEGMKGLLERSLDALITIEIHVPENLPPATVDANQLELAILNLAVNARDAMPDGGTLTISLEKTEGPGKAYGLSGSFLKLCVADTGTGMDEATLQSAIEPFFSTKELGKGTGLGLSMVHGLAQQLGGTLKLHSKIGKGTVAELWLPIANEPIIEIKEIETVKLEAPPSKILVVDDDALIAMNTVDMVEDLGHTVLEAYSGKQALEILNSGVEVDALITDYAMPGMTGVELALKARELHPNLPILLATGYADLPSGTTTDLPRLAKPYQQSDLAHQLSKLLVERAVK